MNIAHYNPSQSLGGITPVKEGGKMKVRFPNGDKHEGKTSASPIPFVNAPLLELVEIEQKSRFQIGTNKKKKKKDAKARQYLTEIEMSYFRTLYFAIAAKRREYNGELLAIVNTAEIAAYTGTTPSYCNKILRKAHDMGWLKKEGYNRNWGTVYSFPLYPHQ